MVDSCSDRRARFHDDNKMVKPLRCGCSQLLRSDLITAPYGVPNGGSPPNKLRYQQPSGAGRLQPVPAKAAKFPERPKIFPDRNLGNVGKSSAKSRPYRTLCAGYIPNLRKFPVFFPVIGNWSRRRVREGLAAQPISPSPPTLPAILRDAAKNSAKWRVFRALLSSPLTPRRSPTTRMGHFWPIVSFPQI